MTLLDDLQGLDLTAISGGKVAIHAAINTDELRGLLENGAVTSVLGELGQVITAAAHGFEDPAALVQPLRSALSAVLEGIDTDLPVAGYLEAVGSAARIVVDLVAMLSGDPHQVQVGGHDVGTALSRAAGPLGDHVSVVSGNLARFQALVTSVERGLPADPAALIGPALEILLPFHTAGVDTVRQWATGLTGQLDQITIDPGLTSGLVNAFGRVTVAIQAGSPADVAAALADLDEVRRHTISQLAAALRQVARVVSALPIAPVGQSLGQLRATLSSGEETVIDQLGSWRGMLAEVRAMVAAIDPAVATDELGKLLDTVEATARDTLLGAVDTSVEEVRSWLRGLLREVPIRPLRLQLGDAIATAAHAVAAADLDAPVEAVRGVLTRASEVLAHADPAHLVQAAVTELERVIGEAIDKVAAAMADITAGINQVAHEAEAVLSRAVTGLGEVDKLFKEVEAAVAEAGIVDAAHEIAASLDELRQQIGEVLGDVPIPEALRGVVDQLIGTLSSIDLDSVIRQPLMELAAQLEIPAGVGDTIHDGLTALTDAIASVVPQAVIAELEGMLKDLVGQIQQLDVSSLLGGVTGLLDEAADQLGRIRLVDVIDPVGEVFDQVLSAVDQVHPRVVLGPAIELYGQLVRSVPVPDPETITRRVGAVTSQAGESAARAAVGPVQQAVTGGGAGGGAAAAPPASGGGPAPEEPPADLRPGDIIRLVGYLPAKLREALAALGAGERAAVLARIDGGLSDTATALRQVRDRLWGLGPEIDRALHAALAPVTAAQVDAQLALSASVHVAAGGGAIDVDASFAVLATAGVANLQAQLAGERELIGARCEAAAGALTGSLADDLDQVADLLDAVLPSGLLADADAFLAALDPEPLAAELDAVLAQIVDATPAFLTAAEAELRGLEQRIRGLIDTFNPGTLMQRYLGVLDVVREELALLDPGRLADELSEIHAEVRAAIAAYDPRALAAELDGLLARVVAAIRALNPAGLMPDLSGIGQQVARLADILPVNALAGVGTELEAVGAQLLAIDIDGMLETVDKLPEQMAEAIGVLVTSVRDEITALLQAIRYTSGSGQVSVQASVEVG